MSKHFELEKGKGNARIDWLDFIRVFACFSVVLYHVINGYMKDAETYTQMNWTGWADTLWNILKLYHVPTFFAISGYLYQKFTAEKFSKGNIKAWTKNYVSFQLKKICNLLIPYLIFSVLYIALSSFLEGDMHTSYGFKKIFTLYKSPVAQYWYLYTLYIIFFLAPVITRVIRGNGFAYIFVGLIFFYSSLLVDVSFLGIQSSFIFFALGYFMSWNNNILKLAEKLDAILITLLMAAVIVIYIIFQRVIANDLSGTIKLIFSVLIISLIFLLSTKLWKKGVPKCVSGCAGITLHIYLIHTWITGPIRVILRHIGVWGLIPHIIIGFFVGSAINILVCMLVKKVWFFNIFFEPVSTFYNKKTKLKIKKGQSEFN